MTVQIEEKYAKAIEALKGKMDNEAIIKEFMDNEHNIVFENSDVRPLRYINLDTLIKALYIGYKIKPKPEDVVRSHFEYALKEAKSDDYDVKFTGKATVEAIRLVTDVYDIKIEGVTDVDIENL
ncbi:hypothetical protein [Priestia megaterium]|uniref:hypothetical protein n=1 Tax=Priestia megaterium TaxID=1404 RepID=UPI00287786D8|nr:hypothetical protein [Priestia megaterium]